jgi:transposase-like protein
MPSKDGKWKGIVNIRVVIQPTYRQGRLKVQTIPSSFSSRWLNDRSIRECVIVVPDEGGMSASTARELYGVPTSTARAWLQKYRRDGQVGRRIGTELWRVSSAAEDDALGAKAQRNPFVSARDLKAAIGFPGQKKPHAYTETKGSRPQGTTRCGGASH